MAPFIGATFICSISFLDSCAETLSGTASNEFLDGCAGMFPGAFSERFLDGCSATGSGEANSSKSIRAPGSLCAAQITVSPTRGRGDR
ncbi:MAG: hypothetical protein IJC63_05890, partial [Myxococcaceae bacterium]|nr:hypothetical protein [Myxococcaceae bacterium]